jgi:predicted amidophosphoribosyltransferase
MSLLNCGRCGKLFNSEKSGDVCPDCVMEENRDLRKVTDYLRKNPLAGVIEVKEKTGVPQQQIFRMINSGSLKISGRVVHARCRLCGKDIAGGTICRSCEQRIKG